MAYPVGAALLGFNDAFLQGAALRRQAEQDAITRTIQNMQIDALRRGAAREAALPDVLSNIMTMPSGSVEVAPELTVPGRTLVRPILPEAPPGLDETFPAVTATPSRTFPAVSMDRLTYPDVAQRLGSEGLRVALGTPEGQRALTERGVETPQSFEDRKKLYAGIESAKRIQGEIADAELAGDGMTAIRKSLELNGVLMETAKTPQQLAVFETHRRDILAQLQKLNTTKQERDWYAEDSQHLAPLFRKFITSGEPADLYDYYEEGLKTAKSDTYKRRLETEGAAIIKGQLTEMNKMPATKRLFEQALTLLQEKAQTGPVDATDLERAMGAAMNTISLQDPALGARAKVELLAGRKQLPESVMTFMGIQPDLRTTAEQARREVEEQTGLKPGDDGYFEAVNKRITELTVDRQRKTNLVNRTVENVRALRNQDAQALGRIQAQLSKSDQFFGAEGNLKRERLEADAKALKAKLAAHDEYLAQHGVPSAAPVPLPKPRPWSTLSEPEKQAARDQAARTLFPSKTITNYATDMKEDEKKKVQTYLLQKYPEN